MKKLNKKWMIAGIVAAVLTVSCVAVAAVAYQANTPQEVSEQQAKEIAFKHAGVSEGDVSELEVHRELENGREVYSVEFGANGKEYEYDVRISDGEIVKSSEEARGLKESQAPAEESTLPAESQASATETAAPDGTGGSGSSGNSGNSGSSGSSTAVTAEQARAIALEHAGVAESDVKFINVEEDYDDGVAVYEVEFYAGNREYDYEIVKATGEILKYDHDAEGYTPPAADNGDNQVKITLEEARQKALAKVSGATEQDIRLALDWDDGRPVYEGEIYYGNMEYEFEIDANTGNFLEWSSDYRD